VNSNIFARIFGHSPVLFDLALALALGLGLGLALGLRVLELLLEHPQDDSKEDPTKIQDDV
jgi:hypothetical protein